MKIAMGFKLIAMEKSCMKPSLFGFSLDFYYFQSDLIKKT
jgi:hypothetical protein